MSSEQKAPLLEILGYAEEDVCGLSEKQAEGVYVRFSDGSFEGYLSWKSLRGLVKLKHKHRMRQQNGEVQEK